MAACREVLDVFVAGAVEHFSLSDEGLGRSVLTSDTSLNRRRRASALPIYDISLVEIAPVSLRAKDCRHGRDVEAE